MFGVERALTRSNGLYQERPLDMKTELSELGLNKLDGDGKRTVYGGLLLCVCGSILCHVTVTMLCPIRSVPLLEHS